MGGVAGQWLSGQLQPSVQHPPAWSGMDLCGFALAASAAMALAHSALIPSVDVDMAPGAACSRLGMTWACRGEDIVAKTNISPIRMRAQNLAMAVV